MRYEWLRKCLQVSGRLCILNTRYKIQFAWLSFNFIAFQCAHFFFVLNALTQCASTANIEFSAESTCDIFSNRNILPLITINDGLTIFPSMSPHLNNILYVILFPLLPISLSIWCNFSSEKWINWRWVFLQKCNILQYFAWLHFLLVFLHFLSLNSTAHRESQLSRDENLILTLRGKIVWQFSSVERKMYGCFGGWKEKGHRMKDENALKRLWIESQWKVYVKGTTRC